LVTGSLLTLLLALPAASVYAQDATGFVSCEQSGWGDSSVTYKLDTIVYPISLSAEDFFFVADRWGTGKDVDYHAAIGAVETNKKATSYNVYIYSMSDPDNPATYEQLYSETGKLLIRVTKDTSMSITGKSVAVAHMIGLQVVADCTWTLTGTLPPGFLPSP
jgi:hypothetical protein